MRVYFDASVLIASVLSSTGGSSKLLSFVKENKLIGIISQTVIDEVLEKREKIKKSKVEIEEFIAKSGLLVRKDITVNEVTPYMDKIDLEDAHLIAGALLTKCTHLVSLDKKHVLKEDIKKRFLPLRIVSTKELFEEIKIAN